MIYNGLKLKNLSSMRSALAFALVCMFVLLRSGYASSGGDALSLDAGFRQMYNLEFAAAHKTFEAWQEQHPDDPLGAASNAAAYLFTEFDRLHILELSIFTDNRRLEERNKLNPDPQIKAAFDAQLSKADEIADKVLAQSSDDRNALFAKVLSDGLRADYKALVEKRMRDGLGFLKTSRTTAEKLISIDPTYHDAYLALGIENYVLGIRSAPTRWMLRLSGAQTSKDKGIANLQVTAEKGRYLAPYARVLLAIAALRDDDRSTARKFLSELAHDFPQNRLYYIELAKLER